MPLIVSVVSNDQLVSRMEGACVIFDSAIHVGEDLVAELLQKLMSLLGTLVRGHPLFGVQLDLVGTREWSPVTHNHSGLECAHQMHVLVLVR